MGDTPHIFSYFTTHSSDCLFTGWYVQYVSVLVIAACLCVLVFTSICIFCIFYLVPQCMTMSGLCMHACVSVRVCGCLLAASYLTSCLFWTPADLLLFCQTEPKPEQEEKHSRKSLCLPSYPFLLNEEDQKLFSHETWLKQIKLISFPVTTVYMMTQSKEKKVL